MLLINSHSIDPNHILSEYHCRRHGESYVELCLCWHKSVWRFWKDYSFVTLTYSSGIPRATVIRGKFQRKYLNLVLKLYFTKSGVLVLKIICIFVMKLYMKNFWIFTAETYTLYLSAEKIFVYNYLCWKFVWFFSAEFIKKIWILCAETFQCTYLSKITI